MRIERDEVPVGHVDTFLDFRRPLTERLEKLALLIGSDAWSADQAPQAEMLIREAALRLAGFMTEATGRKSVLDAITTWNNSLRVENERLRQEVRELELALFDSSGGGMDG